MEHLAFFYSAFSDTIYKMGVNTSIERRLKNSVRQKGDVFSTELYYTKIKETKAVYACPCTRIAETPHSGYWIVTDQITQHVFWSHYSVNPMPPPVGRYEWEKHYNLNWDDGSR